MSAPAVAHSDAWVGCGCTLVWYGDDPRDPPLLRRGRCVCGMPITVEHDLRTWNSTFVHDETPLFCTSLLLLGHVPRGPRCSLVEIGLIHAAIHDFHSWAPPHLGRDRRATPAAPA